ncbi:M43 family zinc metalloprotease [Fluviicola taffensis]|uniref:PKD domain containing protein n=1 Tax=Fluviicola taffensis (strain DSM 16823 / NCIMB 13979 / RW262) TaxID=755732 RepID=F2IBC5_FLUTR|nr:M43 family zinc metalloprotease [Fluviicola taffensis]AEA43211.1 PKD domain containing protein [Fluviicola taffensis DSM 16823]
MKKQFYSLLGISLLSISSSFAQKQERVLDKQNMREGEHVEYCTTHKKMAELKKDPKMAALIAQAELEAENQTKSKGDNNTTKATVYKIPIVFHILQNGGNENISREQILDAVAILNRDYRKLNTDANIVQAPFQGMPTDVEIEFELAKKDPNGNCFTGITRTNTALTIAPPDQGWSNPGGLQQVNAVIAGNDVYQGVWSHTKYLNIYVASDIGGAAGYTFNPGMGGSTASPSGMFYNGIFMLHNYTGSIGTSSPTSSRALTHEVGHWLNLSHVWGGTNDPGVSCGSDGVNDTPACIGSTSCVLTANTCNSDNAFWGFDQIDNVENYMDYSYCSKMFTQGQVDRMRNALLSSTSGRNQLITVSNHAATGINSAPTLCKAKFSTPRTTVCAGQSIQYTDESYNVATGWTWTFTGGSPASSSSQNPTITYNTPGTYAVKLVATDGSTSNTSDIAAYITVLPAGSGLPYYESFESSLTLNSPNWSVFNGGGAAWAVTNTAGKTGSNSVKLDNFSQANGQVDELISGAIDLSSITSTTGATLSFKQAFRKKAAANSDLLRIFISKDCGETWDPKKTITSGTMSGGAIATSTWTPTAADWLTVHVTNVTSAYWVSNFRCKFQLTSGGGNNLYIDDINIYAGAPSETPVTAGLEDLGTLESILLFPNPAENEVQISFNSQVGNNEIKFYVTDLTGKRLTQHVINASEGNNLVLIATENLSAGTYLIQMVDGSSQRTLNFVKK